MESSKWKGCIQAPVAAPLQLVWEITSDFYAMKKWHPGLDVCERVEGAPENGPGCTRYVASSTPTGTLWAKEKLNAMDSAHHSYNYTVVDTNIEGFKDYQATFQVIEGEEQGTCLVKWSFELYPIPGKSEEDLVNYWSSLLSGVLKTLQDAVAPS
ncbi:hypothetical protein SUGI_1109830 [Cryptomeria japonica]|uniref:lachrymatory-factor synthase n=1 Tax=Cryptomeria japonica TaxID=3369 RepID=UPI0024147578|nr:lachrymatory-factor synthase [Cryptomeria japonica]GLJ52174.1 hypothetical protein SUGI_1109830 [Cryptomeria japonica]